MWIAVLTENREHLFRPLRFAIQAGKPAKIFRENRRSDAGSDWTRK
jgi:hypothetical protein